MQSFQMKRSWLDGCCCWCVCQVVMKKMRQVCSLCAWALLLGRRGEGEGRRAWMWRLRSGCGRFVAVVVWKRARNQFLSLLLCSAKANPYHTSSNIAVNNVLNSPTTTRRWDHNSNNQPPTDTNRQHGQYYKSSCAESQAQIQSQNGKGRRQAKKVTT